MSSETEINDRLTPERMSQLLSQAIQQGYLSDTDTSVIFHDLAFLKNRIQTIIKLFPKNTTHAVAAKANPLPKILEILKSWNLGVEAATIGEVYLAQKTGYSPDKIIFDSPAKTESELQTALKSGIYINADSFDELRRIASIKQKINSGSKIGLRINPQVGKGRIAATSVAGSYSKFGLPLDEKRDDLLKIYNTYDWLQGIHVHIGSQGCSLGQLVSALRKTTDFVNEVNRREQKIKFIDIGGGLPVKYNAEYQSPSLEEYIEQMQKQCPELYSDKYQLITEFGRYIHANAGFTASRVEYIKSYGDTKTAIIHVGADLLMRHCYMPHDWPHDISVADADGKLKNNQTKGTYTIAGPLCFGGDIVEPNILLPELHAGDYIIIHDTGAYTLSMWNRHTSRLIPKVLGYDGEFIVLKERETLDELYEFWNK